MFNVYRVVTGMSRFVYDHDLKQSIEIETKPLRRASLLYLRLNVSSKEACFTV